MYPSAPVYSIAIQLGCNMLAWILDEVNDLLIQHLLQAFYSRLQISYYSRYDIQIWRHTEAYM